MEKPETLPSIRRRSGSGALALAALAWLVSAWLAIKLGAVSDLPWDALMQLRVPRVILASAVGLGLAVAGAALQALFSNPLAEPYTLGISSGSSLGAVIGLSLGVDFAFAGVALPAFVGAMVFGGALYLVSLRPGAGNLTLLLTGVMLSFLGSSFVALWMALADANGIQGAIFWLMGDLSRARMGGALLTLLACVLLSGVIWARWRDLDALLLGEEDALSIGISVTNVRRALILLTSLLIGFCVASSGMIGFVGLVVPHFVRTSVGALHRRLIPLAALWGAAVLVLADMLARVAARPYELPVGVVTALIGAPLFLWVMLRQRGLQS